MRLTNLDQYQFVLHRSLCSKLALYEVNRITQQNFSYLKPKQIDSIVQACITDILVTLPTGYGKSIIFELLPHFCRFSKGKKTSVIIVSPLNAIIIEKLDSYGDQACHVSKDFIQRLADVNRVTNRPVARDLRKFINGDYTYIIGHPEDLLHPLVLDILKSDLSNDIVSHIVVDEAHCIVTWGENFRKDFLRLSTLRAQLCNTKVVAMTATATSRMQKDIARSLHFASDFKVIQASPDRENIMYKVKSRPASTGGQRYVEDSYDEVLVPMMKGLEQNIDFYPKTVIYTKLKWCGYAHELATRILGPKLRHFSEEGDFKACVAQYHAPQTNEMKETISKAMRDPQGPVRILLATQAYGMGTDAPDIRRVVHIGPTNTPEAYVQESGRAGRDGYPATATIYCNASDLALNVTHLSEEMREYCKTKNCRRKMLMRYFGFVAVDVEPQHLCCDNCIASCQCEDCRALEEPEDQIDELPEMSKIKSVILKEDAKLAIRQTLQEYFVSENSVIQEPLPELVTGLCSNMASVIANNYVSFMEPHGLKQEYPNMNDCYVQNIVAIISHIYRQYHLSTTTV